ncbi:MAG: hypothetical protein JW844_04505 [Candidatus Omnitrophica bacterium]|nr:hypothetical protein [Candidatus Omnitrophota bacterium]
MKKEIRIAAIGLLAISVLSIGLGVWALGSKGSVSKKLQVAFRKAADLEDENAVLQEKLATVKKETSSLQEKARGFQDELKGVREERDTLLEKCKSLEESRESLVEKLKYLTQEKEEVETQLGTEGTEEINIEEIMQQVGRGGDSEFVARLLRQRAELEVDLKNAKGELEALRVSAEEARAEAAKLTQQFEGLTRAKQSLEEKLARNNEVSDKLTHDYVVERDQRIQLTQQNEALSRDYENARNDLDELRRNFEEASRERMALSRELDAMNQVLDERQREMARLRSVVDQLTGRTEPAQGYATSYMPPPSSLPPLPPISSGSAAVELPPIVVRSEAPSAVTGRGYGTGSYGYGSRASVPSPMPPPSLPNYTQTPSSYVSPGPSIGGFGAGFQKEGKILTVNQEHNFVVINVGRDEGVTIGMPFLVYRAGKPIGEIEIIEVRQSIAAADVIKLGPGIRELQKDDSVQKK